MDLFDKFYANSCIAVLEHFCDKAWPCSFVSKKGKACVNVKSSHMAKGHQCARGKIISSGPYLPGFSSFKFSEPWKGYIRSWLFTFEQEFVNKRNDTLPKSHAPLTATDTSLAYSLHQRHMAYFFRSFEGFRATHFTSLTTCYSCFMEVPEHPLQCGHVLCTPCVKAYGHPHDRNSVIMDWCPLHPDQIYAKPWILYFKPKYAGVRVLALDGLVILMPSLRKS